jgi:hypothetical protein
MSELNTVTISYGKTKFMLRTLFRCSNSLFQLTTLLNGLIDKVQWIFCIWEVHPNVNKW